MDGLGGVAHTCGCHLGWRDVLRAHGAAAKCRPLDAAIRLPLWHRVFQRFFPWVWACVVAILASGYAMVILGFGGFAAAPVYVNAMMLLGIAMASIFWYIYFGPWPRFAQAVPAADWIAAEKAIARIRAMVRVNLTLGLITTVVGASGRYFG